MNFGRVSVHFPKINKAEVWLCKMKNLSSKRERREEERGGMDWAEEEGKGYK